MLYNEEKITLIIWDTAGEEKFHSLSSMSFKDTDGFLLVFDINNEESFKNL